MKKFYVINKKLVLFMPIMTCYNQTCKFFERFLQIFSPGDPRSKNKFVCMEW